MYALTTHQTQLASGGVFGMSMYQMQYLTTMGTVAVPQILMPMVMSSTGMRADSAIAKSMTNTVSILATAASFVAGNTLFPEPEKVTTVVYHLCNQTFAG
jgi:hypothetical protein